MLYEIAFNREAQRELINGMSEANSLPEPPGKLQQYTLPYQQPPI